jgi:predicted transposase YbfD/YdcC
MGCQSQIAAKILAQKADYLLAVKGNQPSLQVTLQERFGLAQREALQQAGQYARFSEKPHGRFVWQEFWVAANAGEVDVEHWPGCKMLGMVESLRSWRQGLCARTALLHSSRAMPAIDFAKAVRAHWGIENGVHWMLDVNFQEDAATVRKDYAADNLSRLKRIVLNLLKTETATQAKFGKISMRMKRKLAAWEDGYREAMLGIRLAHDG